MNNKKSYHGWINKQKHSICIGVSGGKSTLLHKSIWALLNFPTFCDAVKTANLYSSVKGRYQDQAQQKSTWISVFTTMFLSALHILNLMFFLFENSLTSVIGWMVSVNISFESCHKFLISRLQLGCFNTSLWALIQPFPLGSSGYRCWSKVDHLRYTYLLSHQ